MKTSFTAVGLYAAVSLFPLFPVYAQGIHPVSSDRFIPGTYDLDMLPLLPSGIKTLQFSSRRKDGRNGDAGYVLYTNSVGEHVLFDAYGPGCIRSMWGTDIQSNLMMHFYINDNTDPSVSLPVREFYRGQHRLFPAPLTSYQRTGYHGEHPYAGNSFIPIPFRGRLRITTSGPVPEFYHIIYDIYSAVAHAPSAAALAGGSPPRLPEKLIQACRNRGGDPKDDKGTRILTTTDSPSGFPGLQYNGSGSIRRISVDMPVDKHLADSAYLEICFDGAPLPQVITPLGMLFASAYEPHAMTSLPVMVEHTTPDRVRGHIYVPMPFWKSFRLNFRYMYGVNITNVLSVEAAVSERVYPEKRSGYFTAVYHEGKTTYDEDWLLADIHGHGWYIGTIQSMCGEHYCEGDERFYLDGSATPAWHGTGSEDYYLCCFWPNIHFNLPFGGCVGDVYKESMRLKRRSNDVPSSYYRFHLEAPIPFYSGMKAAIEHGGNSYIISRYRSLALFYVRKHKALETTDMIDVGNTVSEAMHAYCSSNSSIVKLSANYEGELDRVDIQDTGRKHQGGSITFSAAISSGNNGVRLRRRIDQGAGRQRATVFVDGSKAGTWYYPDINRFKRWTDTEFEIPEQLTHGKDNINITLQVEPIDGTEAFTDFRYWILCYQ